MWGDSGNLLLRLSHNQEEVAAYNEAVEKGEDDLPDVTCYVRVGQPRIVYGISESVYDQLTAVSYDTLCRQKLFAADFDAVTSIDVALNGENYSGVPINAEKKLRVKEEYDMNPNSTTYQAYVQILKEELLPAMGCTEPIAIAYCAARARAMLGALPDAIEVEASGNIIKNVKSVVVPNTEGRKGLEAAAAIGVLGGDADKGYEVIASISSEVKKQLGPYLEATPIMVRPANSDYVLDVSVLARSGEHYALVHCSHRKGRSGASEPPSLRDHGERKPRIAEHPRYLRLCQDRRSGRCARCALPADSVQQRYFRRRPAR